MFPKHQNNRGDSSETPGLGLTRCLSSKAREVWNSKSKTHEIHGGPMRPVGPVGFWYLDPLQIWPFFYKTFFCGFFFLTSGLWKAFFSPIALVVINKWGVKLCICNFLFCFCIFLYFVRCTGGSNGVTVASANTDSMQRNWCLVNAKAREVWCCAVFGVKPLQSLLQSESQAGKRCVTVEVISNVTEDEF